MTAQSGCECQIVSFWVFREIDERSAPKYDIGKGVRGKELFNQAALMKHTGA